MALVDTKSMESVGVRERSVGTYDVYVAPTPSPAVDRSDWKEDVRAFSQSGSDLRLQKSASASEVKLEEGSRIGAKAATHKPPESEALHPSDVKAASEQVRQSSETNVSHAHDEEVANVEKWRQDVETPDETQARIDAVIAANEVTEGPATISKDENPRVDRAKAGLVPGKKVYCSHWIRSGDCDFVQQGCLYKHEMPDDATLRAIGIRALPSWYIAAHPEKAQKRGWGSGSRAGSPSFRSSTWKPSTTALPGPASRSFRMPLQAHFPSLQPSGPSHPTKTGPSFLRPQAAYPQTFRQTPMISKPDQQVPYPRVQELSDHQYQQWQDGLLDRPNGLQIVQKPRSPGYNTFPFPMPVPVPSRMPSPLPRASQTEAKPLWPPRQSKFTKVAEDDTLQPNRQRDGGLEPTTLIKCEAPRHSLSGLFTDDDQSRQSNRQAATSSASFSHGMNHANTPKISAPRPIVENDDFAPLKPSTVPEAILSRNSTLERQPKIPPNPFGQAPGQQQAPRRMFTRTGREAGTAGSKTLERKNQAYSTVQEDAKEVVRQEAITSKQHYQIHADKIFGRKTVAEYHKKKPSCSPEDKPKAKRAVNKGAPSVERLLDYES
ncbi:MAG: hypothetical protein Q9169_000884 [Polycauliona sp. 2 TL-2023]